MTEPPLAKARRLAKTHTLTGLSFRDKDGNPGARGNKAKTVVLNFTDGESVTLTRQELAMLKGVRFKSQVGAP